MAQDRSAKALAEETIEVGVEKDGTGSLRVENPTLGEVVAMALFLAAIVAIAFARRRVDR